MAKINASTGQVIKKDGSDIHVPHELQQVQPEQQVEEHADQFIRGIDPEYLEKSEERVADDADDDMSSSEDAAREEELQLDDDSTGLM